ncbi:hypothetical protein AJ80_06908 [Polytolypa hystricis UAMH7299]|uniref:EF-hand domain-containing protein n=1 Tax=Polytolypa hystricis (strain UAMH7299) TaxID=1447883 RepID=A0A2B7XT42_POLH7|nr:hypothetical protein AJ80_06908 [Polytolypa hystricis UAMH7299]
MLFQPTKILRKSVAWTSLLSTVAGVNVIQYSRDFCSGNRGLCTNIGSTVCCITNFPWGFDSAKVSGTTSDTDYQYVYNWAGGTCCGRRVSIARAKDCISTGSNLCGHAWCRDKECAKLPAVVTTGAAAAGCNSSVKANLVEIDNKWFDVSGNGTVSEAHIAKLWSLSAAQVPAAEIPKDLLKYETLAPALDDDGGMEKKMGRRRNR